MVSYTKRLLYYAVTSLCGYYCLSPAPLLSLGLSRYSLYLPLQVPLGWHRCCACAGQRGVASDGGRGNIWASLLVVPAKPRGFTWPATQTPHPYRLHTRSPPPSSESTQIGYCQLIFPSALLLIITAGPISKLLAWGGAMRYGGPRLVWTSLPITHYRSVRAHRNWQIETAACIWPVSYYVL